MDNNIYYLIGPAVTLAAGVFFYLKRQRLVRGGHEVEGEVIEMQEQGRELVPIIRFTTRSGDTILYRYRVSQGMRLKMGQKVKLLYNPNKPTEVLIDSVSDKWAPWLLIAISVAMFIMFFFFLPARK